MAGTYLHTAKRLQTACRKLFGVNLLIQQRQWYSEDKQMAMTYYTVHKVDIVNGKKTQLELFHTYSQVQLVLFMRDFWYSLNGWEVPNNNPIWEEAKRQYAEKPNEAKAKDNETTS